MVNVYKFFELSLRKIVSFILLFKMFVKIRIRYVFQERFIFGSELPLPGLEKRELPAKAGVYLIFFARYHN